MITKISLPMSVIVPPLPYGEDIDMFGAFNICINYLHPEKAGHLFLRIMNTYDGPWSSLDCTPQRVLHGWVEPLIEGEEPDFYSVGREVIEPEGIIDIKNLLSELVKDAHKCLQRKSWEKFTYPGAIEAIKEWELFGCSVEVFLDQWNRLVANRVLENNGIRVAKKNIKKPKNEPSSIYIREGILPALDDLNETRSGDLFVITEMSDAKSFYKKGLNVVTYHFKHLPKMYFEHGYGLQICNLTEIDLKAGSDFYIRNDALI